MPRDKFGKIILIRIAILYHSNQVEYHVPLLLTYSVTITILCYNRRIQHSTVSPEQVVREMASHMSSIGFPIETIEDVKVLGKRAVAQATQTLTIPGLGYYRVWSPGAGVEIWGHGNQQRQFLGLE